jgi:hypothetical protein
MRIQNSEIRHTKTGKQNTPIKNQTKQHAL